MKVFIVTGEHWEVPGRSVSAFASKASANIEAASLVNIFLKDMSSKWVAKPTTWKRYLKLVQKAAEESSEFEPYVNITELELQQ